MRTFFAVTIILTLFCTSAFGQDTTYTVQVAACERLDSAESIVKDLEAKGYSPYIKETADQNGKTWFIVRLEDFSLKGAAEASASEFNADTGSTAVVTTTAAAEPAQPVAETEAVSPSPSPQEVAKPSEPKPVVVPPAPAPPSQPAVAQPTEQAPAVMAIDEPPQSDRRMDELQKELESLQEEMKQIREQQEARRKLEITEDEKAAKEKEILQAAGREYTTMKSNTLGLELNFNYQYYSYDVITQATEVEQHANHNLTSSIFTEYAVLDNMTLNLNVPFSYKWDNTGTDVAKEVTDLGDVSVGFQYQPLRSGGTLPTTILFGSFTFDMGRSPYEINVDKDLATGNGYYSAAAGLSMSKTIDPIIAFGNVSYNYTFKAESLNQPRNGLTLREVDPGDSISGTLGMGFALSYNVSMNFSYQYTYRFSSTYTWEEIADTYSGSQTQSMLYIGTGWRFTPKTSLNMKVGIGLTDEDPDFVVSFRLPFEFDLSD
ncbi:SPOR domain-containing protein [Desulfosarcina widdelii]|nr:SPOR domain-containing protein [Desulfosarcina widdelii]